MTDQTEPRPKPEPSPGAGPGLEYWPAYRRDEELPIFQFLALLMRQRRVIAGAAVACFALTALVSLVLRKYEARASFVLQTPPSSVSQLAGIAAQFGFSVGGSQNTQSIDFYEQLVTSRELLTAVATTVYRFPKALGGTDSLSGTFVELYGIHEDTPQETLLRAVRKLGRVVDVAGDLSSGIVTVTVKAKWPGLAEAIGRRVLELVSQFNLESRQSNARNERTFVEERMVQARRELETAEGQLARFLEQNRTYGSSPRLLFEQQRLQRQVDLRQQVYLALAQGYEQARIAEVRDTPVITLVDPPEGSAEPTPRLGLVIALAIVLASIVGVGSGLMRELIVRQKRERPSELGEFRALAKQMLAEVSPRRLIATLRSRRRGK